VARRRQLDDERGTGYNGGAEIGSTAGRFPFDNLVGVHGEPVSATALCSVGAHLCLNGGR